MATSVVSLLAAATMVITGGFETARIGDLDGFGWGDLVPGSPQTLATDGTGPVHKSASTFGNPEDYTCSSINPATDLRPFNRDSAGLLGPGDFLPDLDRRCSLVSTDVVQRKHVKHAADITVSPTTPWTNWTTDDWDWREVVPTSEMSEANGTLDFGTSCPTCVSTISNGTQFTDMTLSVTYRESFPNTVSYPFPKNMRKSGNDRDPADTENQPRFNFDFTFPHAGTITTSTPFFFNTLFADYDVGGEVNLRFTATKANGTTIVVNQCLSKQSLTFEDGLIQGASINLNELFGANWTQVLRAVGTDKYRIQMYVDWVDFDGYTYTESREPYTAFDFAEIALNTNTVKVLNVDDNAPVIPGQRYQQIDDALAYIPGTGDGWTIQVSPGTYDAFDMNGKNVSIIARPPL